MGGTLFLVLVCGLTNSPGQVESFKGGGTGLVGVIRLFYWVCHARLLQFRPIFYSFKN